MSVHAEEYPGGGRQRMKASAHPRFLYVLRGRLRPRISGNLHQCRRGDLLYLPLGEPVPLRSPEGGCQLLAFDQAALADPPIPSPSLPSAALELLPVARRLWNELWRSGDTAELASRGLGLQFLAETARAKGPLPNGIPPWVEEARTRIDEEYATNLKILDVALDQGLTSMALIRGFRRAYGIPPGAYLRQVRLEAALALLEEPGNTLSQIALRSGFTDQSHLSRVVKSATGMTPGQYRRRSGS